MKKIVLTGGSGSIRQFLGSQINHLENARREIAQIQASMK